MSRAVAGQILGPALFALVLSLPLPAGMEPLALRTAAVACLMAVWWVTEAVPIPVTALLPIVLFPALGIASPAEVTRSYAHHLVFLFLGGFMIAAAIERWGLHHRLALHTLRFTGAGPRRIILGFMLATAFLSAWISNTAATMLMMTIGLATIRESGMLGEGGVDVRPGHFRFATSLMLAIAYAASIGGISTLIGSPPNAIFAGVAEQALGLSIGFVDWMKLALPLSAGMLAITWLYLTRIAFPPEFTELPGGRDFLRTRLRGLGPMRWPERGVALVFAGVAALWVLRGTGSLPALAGINDSTIAVAGALILFMIPASLTRREFLLDWATAVRIPWDILLLFGGGFALAHGFSETGLSAWIAGRLHGLAGVDLLWVLGAVSLLVVFLTELTSNTATASLLVPLMAALGLAIGGHAQSLMVAATLAASFAFMLPVATPPNAIVFGTRYVRMAHMVRAGIWLNLVGAAAIALYVYAVLPRVWQTVAPAN